MTRKIFTKKEKGILLAVVLFLFLWMLKNITILSSELGSAKQL